MTSRPDLPERRFYTVDECAHHWRKHPNTIYRYIRLGLIDFIKTYDGYLIPAEQVRRGIRREEDDLEVD